MKHYLCNVVLAHKLGWMAVAGLLGITLLCTGLGCGNDETPSETVEGTNRYVYFEMDGSFLEGYVVEGGSADEVRVRFADDSEMTISIDHIEGTLLADHSDLGVEVVMRYETSDRVFTGVIIGVYDDGMRKIEIDTILFMDNQRRPLDPHRILFVPKDTPYSDGGYLTFEEFERRFDSE